MSKRQKMVSMIISGSLLVAVALVGVSVYQVENGQKEELQIQETADSNTEEENPKDRHMGGNSTATEDEAPHYAVVEDEEEELQTEDAAAEEVTVQEEQSVEPESAETSSGVILPEVNFTEDMLLEWPVEANVIMDYSMDHTVYFPTLDVYKYNPSLLLGAEVGTPVEVVANATIVDISESIETGTTVTADLGNGYQAVFGQLKDVLVKENDVVAAGTVLGYVGEPTRFFTEEGSNLYFAMTKDGVSIDPILYLP